MYELLNKMINSISPSGNEEPMAKLICSQIGSCCDDVTVDTMGNVIAHIKGKGKKIMLAAHMDEIGMMVTNIDDKGFLRFAKMGGLRPEQLLSAVIEFQNGTKGVVSCDEGTALKELELKKLYIDIGAKDKKEAETCVSVGDVAAVRGNMTDMRGRITGKSMDNKISCFVLVETIKRVLYPENDLYFVFTVQEELGMRGAKTAAYAVEPNYAIAVDVTSAGDTPESKLSPLALGAGPAVKLRDASVICHKKMVDFLCMTAKKHGVPYQREVLEAGGSDAGAIHITKSGVITGGVSIVARYIHSSAEMVDKNDVENAIRLLTFAMTDGID